MVTVQVSPGGEVNLATRDRSSGDTLTLLGIAAVIFVAHLLTNGRYGFHRDELQVLSDALHMDWGFVPYPPLTPFVERISMSLFGMSLVGLRLFSALSQAFAIVFTGLIARELGGGRLAQVTAALTTALSTLSMFEGTEFQYTTFDYLWWVLIAYFAIRLLNSGNPRWWLAIGATLGVGFMTKYTMGFYLCGILAGLILTSARRHLLSGWFWAGMALGLAICSPNIIWQLRHGLISLHFLQHIHARDVGEGRANGFWRDQFWVCANLAAAPLWIAGVIGYFRSAKYRMLGWMYVVPLVLFVVGKGRGYYLGAAYPMLMAMGAVMGEHWVQSLSKIPRRIIVAVAVIAIVAWGGIMSLIIFPFASSGKLMTYALENNGDLREEIGWDDLVQEVARIRDSLPPDQQQNVGVMVRNYGEQGAIEILGPAYHLPPPISGINSAWLRGYPAQQPTTLIVLGTSREDADRMYTSCRLAGHDGNRLGVHNEESNDHPDIYLCGPPRLPWPEFWKHFQGFG